MRAFDLGARGAVLSVTLLALGACARWDIAPVAELPDPADPFQAALKSAYLDYAVFERGEADWGDVVYYKEKAAAAGRGDEVLPQPVAERALPPDMVAGFEAARGRVMALYQGRGRQRAPQELAKAEAAFDCWMEQQEEGHQADDIAVCKKLFLDQIAIAEDKSLLKGDVVVLLPDDGGKLGKVAVSGATGGDTQVLETDRAALEVRNGQARSVDITEKEFTDLFADALAAQPPAPRSFTLYFEEGTADLTPESRPLLDEIAADLQRRKSPEIVVIGHTDREGTVPANDRLGKTRAERVAADIKGFLAKQGIRPSRFLAQGRGEREPVVPTDDGVPEPRNRRAEIVVR